MKYCEEYAALLDAYFDGECTPEEAAEVRAHLAGCPGCQAYLDQLLLLRDAFPDDEDTEVPPGFADGVMAAIQAKAAPQKRPARWKKSLLPIAACLAVAVLAAGRLDAVRGDYGSATPAAGAPAAAEAEEAAEEARSTDGAPQVFTSETQEAPVYYDNTSGAPQSEPQSEPQSKEAAGKSAVASASNAAATEEGGARPTEDYLAELTVTAAEAGELTETWTPLDTVGDAVRYTLTPEQLQELLERLDVADCASGKGRLALVTVTP